MRRWGVIVALVATVAFGASTAACQGEQVEAANTDATPSGDSAGDGATSDTTTFDTLLPDDGSPGTDGAPDTTSEADTKVSGDSSFEGGVSLCPTPKPGSSEMIYVPSMKYCIDRTEITDAEYNQFLLASTKPGYPARLKFCEGRTTYGATRPTLSVPATNVEWCHAYQYCLWAGKRLCGKHVGLGERHLAESDGTTPTVSQWTYACKGADPGTPYPYGATFDATKCAIGLASTVDTNDVKYKDCVGGVPGGLKHMSGNAAEWEDACNDSDAPNATSSCRTRGGWYSLTEPTAVQCETGHSYAITGVKPEIGFRCCADTL